MKIFLGADHNGFHLKEQVFAYLAKRGIDVEDVGDREYDAEDDFPEFAQMAAIKVLGEDDARAILICGGGQGMCMAANRFKGIRASVVWDTEEAKWTRNDNDSNVLCLPARVFDAPENEAELKDVLKTWLETPFAAAPRFIRRNKMIDEV